MSVCDDQVLADVPEEFRKLLRTADDTLRQQDVTAVVVVDDACLDVCTGTVWTCIVVRDEADGGDVALDVGLQCGVDVAFVVHLHIAQTFVLQFLLQVVCKH